ncbi:MAG: class I SAM-dependent methyltransferase [Candidatus Acidiferrales bacterium]
MTRGRRAPAISARKDPLIATSAPSPSPNLFFETLNAYQRSAALRSAIELDVFTAIGEGAVTPSAIAARCQAAERGVRILCDYLVIIGFLTKNAANYALTPDSALFLDRRSPACVDAATAFLLDPELVDSFDRLTDAVRRGGSVMENQGSIKPENPLWVEFARAMAPLQTFPAEAIARFLDASAATPWKVLDVAAGHGVFGITLARHNLNAEIYALDWAPVLTVARDNARKAGVASRFHEIPGSAFDVNPGSGYDLILITNFLHHFDAPSVEALLRKFHAALAPHGRVVTLDFIPDENRVTPPGTAAFAIIMLSTTPAGDAYVFSEYEKMFRAAGFSSNELVPLPGVPSRIIVSKK